MTEKQPQQVSPEELVAINDQLRATISNLQTRIGQITSSYEVEIAYLKAQNTSLVAALKSDGKTTIFGDPETETTPKA